MPPHLQVFQDSHFHRLSPDNQTVSLAPLGLAFVAPPPKEWATVIDLGRTRYGVRAPGAPPVNVERLNASLTDVAINLVQSLSLGALSDVTNIAQTGADLTGLIHNLFNTFNTDLGGKVQPQLQNVPTSLRVVLVEGSQNSRVAGLVEQGIRAVGKLAGGGATYNVLAGAALAANQGPQSALEAGSTGARLDEALERAGGLPAFISQ